MTNRQAIEFASKHSFLELYEEGKKDGKAEAILTQANHDEAVKQAYQQGRADAIDEVIAMFKADFDKQNRVNSLYVPTVVVNENIYIDLQELKEQKNDS